MKKVLIVVDMLNDFVHEKGALSFKFARFIVPFIKERIEAHIADNNIIIFLCDAHDGNDKEFERFPKHAVKKTWGAGIIKELADAVAGYYSLVTISKTRYSGFYGTNLGTQLADLAPDEVEVVGVATSICVSDTVGGLANRDYNVIVPIKGVADFDTIAHINALERMEKLYGAKIIEPY